MPDVFLSYSREDQTIARRFAEGLEREGFDVWWDQSLNPGETYDEATSNALDSSLAVVLLWSPKSVTSRWVRSEATLADRQGKLFPAQIETCRLPIQFELTQTADLTGWSGDPGDARWQSFVASLRRVFARQGQASAAQTGARPSPSIASPAASPASPPAAMILRRNRPLYIGIAVIVMLGIAVTVWKMPDARHGQPTPSRNAAATGVAAAVAATQPSIAVLPFVNMSSDKEQEYFSDGLSEELLNQLAQIPQLSVIGRTSSFSFKGRNEDLRTIGAKLGATHLLEGSVRKAGNRVKITAQLINAADGVHLWSETYERTLDDIFAIQDEIASTVAKQLEIKLSAGQLRDAGTRNLAAFEALLAGRGLLRSAGQSMSEAVPHLERAVQLDPGYVTAWLWLADAYTRLAFDPQRAAEAYRKQDAVIDEIARIVPGSPEASLAMSYRASRGRNLQELEGLLRRGLLVPGEPGLRARLRLSQFLSSTGQTEQGRVEMLKVRQSDPLDAFVQSAMPGYYYGKGDRARGDQELQRLRELEGGETVTSLGIELVDAMNRGDAPAVTRINTAIAGKSGASSAPFADAQSENGPRALELMRSQFERQRESGDASGLSRSIAWFEFLGNRDLAVQAGAAFAASTFNFETLAGGLWRKVLSGLRSDPRFKDTFRKLGLVEYWRATGNWGEFCRPVGTDDFECR